MAPRPDETVHPLDVADVQLRDRLLLLARAAAGKTVAGDAAQLAALADEKPVKG